MHPYTPAGKNHSLVCGILQPLVGVQQQSHLLALLYAAIPPLLVQPTEEATTTLTRRLHRGRTAGKRHRFEDNDLVPNASVLLLQWVDTA